MKSLNVNFFAGVQHSRGKRHRAALRRKTVAIGEERTKRRQVAALQNEDATLKGVIRRG